MCLELNPSACLVNSLLPLPPHPILCLLPTFGEGGTHSWGLKGREAGVPMGDPDISTSPKREKPCSAPSH